MLFPLRDADLYGNYATAFRHFYCGETSVNHFGYPNGMGLLYFPSSDWFLTVPANLISCAMENQFVGVNLIWLVSFPLCAYVACWAMSQVRINKYLIVLFSTTITLLPYHWMRLYHVYLATMFSMILGIGLVFYINKKAQLFYNQIERSQRLSVRRHLMVIVIASIVIGGSGLYYAFFSMILLVVSLLYSISNGKAQKHALYTFVSLGTIFLTLFTSYLASFIYQRENPLAFDPTKRNPGESFLYSLNLDRVMMLSPNSGLPLPDFFRSKLVELESITNAYNIPTFEEGGWFSNAILFVCWVTLPMLIILYTRSIKALGSRTFSDESRSDVNRSILLLMVAIVISIPWGLNFIFAVFVSPQIRAWGRMEPAIQFLLLIAVGVMLTELKDGPRGRSIYRMIAIFGMIALLVDVARPSSQYLRTSSQSLRAVSEEAIAYSIKLNTAQPLKCGVLQIPYVGYPEAGDKFHFEVAFQNYEKDWSFGQFRGDPSSRMIEEIGNDIDLNEEAKLVSLGFCGVHLDLRGIPPEQQASVFSSFVDRFGNPKATGLNNAWLYWSFD